MTIGRLRRGMLLGVAAALVTAPVFAQKKYDVGANDTEIKIGGISPYSGPASAYGTIGKGIAAYFEKVNAEGGINGRKIKFNSYDDAYNPREDRGDGAQARRAGQSVADLQRRSGPRRTRRSSKYLNAEEGAAAVRCDRRHEVGRPKELP